MKSWEPLCLPFSAPAGSSSSSDADLADELLRGFEQGVTWQQYGSSSWLCVELLVDGLHGFPTLEAESAERVVRVAQVAVRKLKKYGTSALLDMFFISGIQMSSQAPSVKMPPCPEVSVTGPCPS